jgi:4'-phosphopantetheinyl transferase
MRSLEPRGSKPGGTLTPHLWWLGESPPPLPPVASLPLLVLVDRRQPLPPGRQPSLLASLSAGERQRHAAFRRPVDQQRFLLARAAVRALLGHWLMLPASAVPLDAGPHGKPHCSHPAAPAFNLSHSGDLILLAFHPTCPVGVDVERLRSDLDWSPIARRVLSPATVAALLALPPVKQASAFLSAWCRLEARLKAGGTGLAGLALSRMDAPDRDGVLFERLWDVAVPQGYAAAVALRAAFKAHPVAAAAARHPSRPG